MEGLEKNFTTIDRSTPPSFLYKALLSGFLFNNIDVLQHSLKVAERSLDDKYELGIKSLDED